MADRIQLRRDTAANWTNYNPILLEGEPGIELDTDQWKLGDGVHTWSQLPYRGGECVQQTGQSTTIPMSQKAVTEVFNKSYFVDGQPCIKELYINAAGVAADVSILNNVYTDGRNNNIKFATANGQAFSGQATAAPNAITLAPIYPISGGSTVLGYILIDMSEFVQVQYGSVGVIKDIAKDISYSPYIYVNKLLKFVVLGSFYAGSIDLDMTNKIGTIKGKNLVFNPAIISSGGIIDTTIQKNDTFEIPQFADNFVIFYQASSGKIKAAINPKDVDYPNGDILFGYYVKGEICLNTGIIKVDGVEKYVTTSYIDNNIKALLDLINKFPLFVENCPFIKELYINETGVENDVAKLNDIVINNNRYSLRFSNSDGTQYSAKTDLVPAANSFAILPIYKTTDTTIVGYVICDWRTITAEVAIATALNPIAYKVDYSPRIKEYLDGIEIDEQFDNVSAKLDTIPVNVNIGDRKDIVNIATRASFPALLWLQKPNVILSKVTKIRFKANTGSISFYKVTWDGFGTVATKELITTVENSSAEYAAIKEIFVNVSLNLNQYIAISGDFFFRSTGSTFKGTRFVLDTGVCETAEWDNIDFAWELLDEDSIEYRLDKVEEDTKELSESIYSRYDGRYATLLNEKLNASKDYIIGTQTFGTFGLIVDNPLFINKYYSIQREATFLCKFASDTIAIFGTKQSSDSGYNSSFRIDIANKTVQCRSISVESSAILFADHVIAITIQKDYNHQILRIVNVSLGKEEVFKWTYEGTGISGAGTVQPGMQYDYYTLDLVSGNAFEVSQLVILAPKADLVIYGDSITEAEAYWPSDKIDQHWVQLIVNKMKGRAVASGRSGTALTAMLSRMPNELPFIKPKYVMVTIGTNGEATQQRYLDIVDYIVSIGAIPILNHIPAGLKPDGSRPEITVNPIIDAVRAAKNVTGADFDIVTSIGGVPANGVNPDTMWPDVNPETGNLVLLHPNVEGSMAMYQKVLLDVPQIFE